MHVPSQPFDVIATFAAQISTSPCGAVDFWLLSKLPCWANHPAYFGIGEILFKPTLFCRRRCRS